MIGRWSDSYPSPFTDRFYKIISALGIVTTIVIFTYSSFAVRAVSLSIDTLGPWPDSLDYAYGATGLLRGTYNITWDKCPAAKNINPPYDVQCVAIPANDRKSYYTPGTSILMLPFVAIGGATWATLLDYTSALVIGTTIVTILWRKTNPCVAFLGCLIYLLSQAQLLLSSMAMSDLPTSLFLLGSALLVSKAKNKTMILSGLVTAYLVWLRPQMAVIVPIGLLSIVVVQRSKHKLLLHVVPLLSVLALLGIWQWIYYGTPFTTGYQYNANNLLEDGSFNRPKSDPISLFDQTDNNAPLPFYSNHTTIFDFFSPYYLNHAAWHSDQPFIGGGSIDLKTLTSNIPTIPNPQYYILLLLGFDTFLWPFGVGVIGLLGLAGMTLTKSTLYRTLGIYGIYSTLAIFTTYSFYYYRSDRFFVPVVPFIVLGFCLLTNKLLLHSTHLIYCMRLATKRV